MPYPHVTQFETLERRARLEVVVARTQRAVRPVRAWKPRLRRRPAASAC